MSENQDEKSFERPPLKKGWSAVGIILTAIVILLANSSDNDTNSSYYTGGDSNYNNPNNYSYYYENVVQTACQNAWIQMALANEDLANGNITEAAMHLRNAYTHAPAAEGLEELVNRYNAIADKANQINAEMYQGFGEGVRGVCAANQEIAIELQNQAFVLERNQNQTIISANENGNEIAALQEP